MKWIAVYINTFRGVFEPYGIFESADAADNWVEDIGLKKSGRADRSLWSVIEVKIVT